jgi:hypothetical protein
MAENTGYPVDGVSFPSGEPKRVGVDPGASGAQFKGTDKHQPHPNPHHIP